MEGLLLRLLGAPRTRRTGNWTLRALSAREMLSARAEAAERAAGDEDVMGLWCNAAVLARSVSRHGRRAFHDAGDVLSHLTMGEIEALAERYESLCECDKLSPFGDEAAHESLLAALSNSPYERLKWRVLRAFSALPTERRAREMTDADYLYCALQLALDGREELERLCPACRARAEEERCAACGAPLGEPDAVVVNPAFDEEKFAERKRGDGA